MSNRRQINIGHLPTRDYFEKRAIEAITNGRYSKASYFLSRLRLLDRKEP